MRIKNPTNVDVSVNYGGEVYTVEAGKSVDLPEEVVRHWMNIHQFMVVGAEEEKESGTAEAEEEPKAKPKKK